MRSHARPENGQPSGDPADRRLHRDETATLGSIFDAHPELGCRWGPESLNFHGGERATNAASEGVNGKIETLERMAHGFRSRANYVAGILVMCSGHRRLSRLPDGYPA